jgi:hypothetical protein
MPWLGDRTLATLTRRRFFLGFELWNRRLHFYLGLYFLFFVWLFAFTGLLLNHPKWTFAEFWPNRKQSTFQRTISRPAGGSDLAQASNILQQLGYAGEIEWTATPADSDRLDFRASRPGRTLEIRADFRQGLASIQEIRVNAWGILRILHTFTGVRAGDARNQRDWFLTTLWAFAMDTVSAGLIVMILGSYYMWFRLPRKRGWGAISLSAGVVACGLFVFGLKWLF